MIDTFNKNIKDEEVSGKEKGLNYLGFIACNLMKFNYDIVEENLGAAEEILIEEEMDIELAYLYFYAAYMYSNLYDFTKAYIYIYKAEDISNRLFEEYEDRSKGIIVAIEYLQSSIEIELGMTALGMESFDEAEKLREKYDVGYDYDSIINVIKYYDFIKDYDKVENLATALLKEMDENHNIKVIEITSKFYLAKSYLKNDKIDKYNEVMDDLKHKELINGCKDKVLKLETYFWEREGNSQKELELQEKRYSLLSDGKNYKEQFSTLDRILELSSNLNDHKRVEKWSKEYRTRVNDAKHLKETQYIIGTLGDIDLQNTKYHNRILELESKNLTYLITIVVLISGLAIVIVAIKSRKKTKDNELLESNLNILNTQLQLQYEHYKSIQEYQNQVKILWHDMKHHTNLINLLLEKKEYEECEIYVKSMVEDIDQNKSIIITENRILDAILTDKVNKCKKNNIKLDLDIRVPNKMNIDNYDICIIYKNLLDNAIAACGEIYNEKDRYIKVISKVKGPYLFLQIENSKNNEIKKEKDKFISTKKDSKNHGFGIESVKQSVYKYDGQVKIEYDKAVFKVTALIKMR